MAGQKSDSFVPAFSGLARDLARQDTLTIRTVT
jgi:hypothetical protein